MEPEIQQRLVVHTQRFGNSGPSPGSLVGPGHSTSPSGEGAGAGGCASLCSGHIPKPQEARSLASLQALAVGGRRMPCGFLAPSPTSEPPPFKKGRKVQASSSTVAFRNCLKLFGPGRGS